ESYSFQRVLERGIAMVTDEANRPVTSAHEARPGRAETLNFPDGKAAAVVGGEPDPRGTAPGPKASPKESRARSRRLAASAQGNLF
ncbi:MAG TPA: exodeoxyribonuclease VII large subunit, partial [Arenibaculum sp.]|nr:exodeoxyribonuclease VII large subunit [Arenibaculum sp.]